MTHNDGSRSAAVGHMGAAVVAHEAHSDELRSGARAKTIKEEIHSVKKNPIAAFFSPPIRRRKKRGSFKTGLFWTELSRSHIVLALVSRSFTVKF